MCGIAGIIGNHVTNVDARLSSMDAALAHRGPDDAGHSVWPQLESKPQTAFVHRRLSIIDLSAAGHEPMTTADGRFSIVFNGEVYNFRELRKELQSHGVVFKSQTDTEVVLQLYARSGADCLQRLRGMFAFAIRDDATGDVVIARDHLGIKPLYYFSTPDTFVFASEVRALLDSGLVPRKLNRAGLTSYLQRGSVRSPLTLIENVKSLAPGHYATIALNSEGALKFTTASYIGDWLTPSPATELTRSDAVAALREALAESVRLHLVSDVLLAPFLSGGIDSSALVALMSQVTTEKPKTFSVVFDEHEFSEAPYARIVADKYKTDHHEIHLGEDDLFRMLPAAIKSMDQPTMDGINTYLVSKAVKEAGITVALSGLGGDELFAGYPTFRRAMTMKSLASMPRPIRNAVAAVGTSVSSGSAQRRKLWQLLRTDGTPAATCEVSRQLLAEDEINDLVPGFVTATPNGREHDPDVINSVSRNELTGYMSDTLLRDTDSMSMAHALEVRVPYLDPEVVRLVLSLPGEWKINGGRPKPLLLDALGDLLPEQIVDRPKMGFALPFEKWMQSRLRDELDRSFGEANRFDLIGVKSHAAKQMWQRFLAAPRKVGWSRPWALYVLSNWCAQNQVTA